MCSATTLIRREKNEMPFVGTGEHLRWLYLGRMGKASRKKRAYKTGEVPISAELHAVLDDQLKLFKKKFGREPGPNDPLFFDPNYDTPRPINPNEIEAEIARAMDLAGIDPAKIYAFKKTTLLPSFGNWGLLSDEDRAAWNQALNESMPNSLGVETTKTIHQAS
jgi:hypothetical protein